MKMTIKPTDFRKPLWQKIHDQYLEQQLKGAMQCADKNIDELLEHFNGTFHRLCQSGIDEELFDVNSVFEALSKEEAHPIVE
jgi:F0F1-type ATP synthase gamma subunit